VGNPVALVGRGFRTFKSSSPKGGGGGEAPKREGNGTLYRPRPIGNRGGGKSHEHRRGKMIFRTGGKKGLRKVKRWQDGGTQKKKNTLLKPYRGRGVHEERKWNQKMKGRVDPKIISRCVKRRWVQK